ncbi:MAG TPA: hypothetical protein VNJ07_11755 [Chitinophagales bacterium]|nr:hypothetical protein [Chitinophagales bacterium]
MELSIYSQDIRDDAFEEFMDSVFERELNHFASELLSMGFHDINQIEQSIHRAIMVCRTASIPVRGNFRSVFVCTESVIVRDWRLSDMAMKLAIINADAGNPLAARVQVELIKGS